MPTPNPMTVEHLVGVLRRSRKPSIVVEGDDDVGFCKRQDFRAPDAERVRQIRSAYQLSLRGKQLFQLLVRFLSKPTHGFEKASLNAYALYNLALRMPEGHPLLDRLMEQVKQKIAEQTSAS